MIGRDLRPSEEHQRQCREYCDALLPALRLVAESCGYAIAVHGSLARDIDLIAVPWRDLETGGGYLAQRLHGVVNAVFSSATLSEPTLKPHGRRAWMIRFCGAHYIDLSVMPRIEKS